MRAGLFLPVSPGWGLEPGVWYEHYRCPWTEQNGANSLQRSCPGCPFCSPSWCQATAATAPSRAGSVACPVGSSEGPRHRAFWGCQGAAFRKGQQAAAHSLAPSGLDGFSLWTNDHFISLGGNGSRATVDNERETLQPPLCLGGRLPR